MEQSHSEKELLELAKKRKLLEKLSFDDMPKKFREHRNFLKLAAVLVDYGYMCSWLPVDNEGADFIAIHCKTNDVLKIQLKGRVAVEEKYFGKDIYMAFPINDKKSLENWLIVPHDELVNIFISARSWEKLGGRSSGRVPLKILNDVQKISIIEPVNLQ